MNPSYRKFYSDRLLCGSYLSIKTKESCFFVSLFLVCYNIHVIVTSSKVFAAQTPHRCIHAYFGDAHFRDDCPE
jgi:hypothetical protein